MDLLVTLDSYWNYHRAFWAKYRLAGAGVPSVLEESDRLAPNGQPVVKLKILTAHRLLAQAVVPEILVVGDGQV